jgi:type IV pilus assembly protein PilC
VVETYAYKVRDRGGKLLEGTLEADSQQLLIGKLRSMGYMPIDIQQQNQAAMARELRIPFVGNRVKLKDVAVMSRQFATMINSGLALLRALNILAEQTES